ncbi:hypothetical protein [Candidatus Nitrososphaera evergladensis]|uniref:hypothetical protein n=1 Tax=Candidatus Nitrososphaera evergladensis TaxID=1459637 RepID=UPI0011E5B915|nr:hypothetical protein [Candidatus Nitrososphaera evergladensis]
MNPSSIALLRALKEGLSNLKEIRKAVGVQEWQFNETVKALISQDYIEKKGSVLAFKQNPKTILFRDVSSQYNIEKLLRYSNEQVLVHLVDGPVSAKDIQRSTKLGIATIHRSISDLKSIGAIHKQEEGGDKISIKRDNEDKLYLFARLLKTENERKKIEPYAEVIYRNHSVTIKKVPTGKIADGELTGFSLFSEYGIEYHTAHDYYVKQTSPLTLQDVLLHSIITAAKNSDRNAMSVAMLFYLKNRSRFDPLAIRAAARGYGMSKVWLDVESFIRNGPLRNPSLFPSRKDFEEKARLYDTSSDEYDLPKAYPQLFQEIGDKAPFKISAYLIGGENMRIKGLKDKTKDCDIVTLDTKTFTAVVKVLKEMGYRSINESNLSEDDKRLNAGDILIHSERSSRMDVFNRNIGRNQLYLSERMVKRAKMESFKKLDLGILDDSDIFLLKSIAGRTGDIDDMLKIVNEGQLDWNIVWDEMVKQEDETNANLSGLLLEAIEDLKERKGIEPPFYKKLIRRVLDRNIYWQVRKGKNTLREIVDLLQGADISEKTIRHRIDYLEKKGYLKKLRKRNNEVILEIRNA